MLAFVYYLRSLMVRALHRLHKGVCLIPAGGPIVDDEFFSTVSGLNFDMCYDFHLLFKNYPTSSEMVQNYN